MNQPHPHGPAAPNNPPQNPNFVGPAFPDGRVTFGTGQPGSPGGYTTPIHPSTAPAETPAEPTARQRTERVLGKKVVSAFVDAGPLGVHADMRRDANAGWSTAQRIKVKLTGGKVSNRVQARRDADAAEWLETNGEAKRVRARAAEDMEARRGLAIRQLREHDANNPPVERKPGGPHSNDELPYFDPQTLLDLDKVMADEITKGIHDIKEARGVDKLDPSELPLLRARLRRDVMQRFLGDAYSDDLSGRVEAARLAAVKKYGDRDSGPDARGPRRERSDRREDRRARDDEESRRQSHEREQNHMSPEEQEYQKRKARWDEQTKLIDKYKEEPALDYLFDDDSLRYLDEEIQADVAPKYDAALRARIAELNPTLPDDKKWKSVDDMTKDEREKAGRKLLTGPERGAIVNPIDNEHTRQYLGHQAGNDELAMAVSFYRRRLMGRSKEPKQPKKTN